MSVRFGVLIIVANLLVNVGALFGYNAMRQSSMTRAAHDRVVIQQKLDGAWRQRERLAAATIKACHR